MAVKGLSHGGLVEVHKVERSSSTVKGGEFIVESLRW